MSWQFCLISGKQFSNDETQFISANTLFLFSFSTISVDCQIAALWLCGYPDPVRCLIGTGETVWLISLHYGLWLYQCGGRSGPYNEYGWNRSLTEQVLLEHKPHYSASLCQDCTIELNRRARICDYIHTILQSLTKNIPGLHTYRCFHLRKKRYSIWQSWTVPGSVLYWSWYDLTYSVRKVFLRFFFFSTRKTLALQICSLSPLNTCVIW